MRGPVAILAQIRVPAALPALASGLRVAAAVAPIGAVIGEWVGSSSAGLGYLMLHANARMQVDLMFAAVLVLAAMALLLWLAVDRGCAGAGPLAARDASPRPDGDRLMRLARRLLLALALACRPARRRPPTSSP